MANDKKIQPLNVAQINEREARIKAVLELAGDSVQTLHDLAEGTATAKNEKDASDKAFADAKVSVWDNVRRVMVAVTETAPKDEWQQTLVDVLGEHLVAKYDTEGKKLPLSTIGAYASTGSNVLAKLVAPGLVNMDQLFAESYEDTRKRFKSPTELAFIKRIGEISKQLRYAVKNGQKMTFGTMAANDGQEVKLTLDMVLTALEREVEAIYNPVKQAKDKASRNVQADKELRDGRQQMPTAPSVVEVVAGELAQEDENDVALPAAQEANG